MRGLVRGTILRILNRIVVLPLVLFCVPAIGLFISSLIAGHRFPVRLLLFTFDASFGSDILFMLSCGAASLGVLLIGAVYLCAVICGDNRSRLAAIFAPLVRCLSLGVAALALLQASAAVLSAALFLLGFVHILPFGVVIALVAGAIYTTEELTRVAFGLSQPGESRVNGRAVTRAAQPALWAVLDAVAAKLGARVPDNLVLGVQPSFFATGGKIRLPDKSVLQGETLYLSASSMGLVSQQELCAVIGHELSHFAGDDTRFTLRFLPIYQRLQDALWAAHAVPGAGALSALPARMILGEALASFGRAERRVSRARESAADRSGAQASSPAALMTALLRDTASTAVFPQVIQEVVAAINAGSVPPQACERVIELALAAPQSSPLTIADEPKTGVLDTHPTLAARAKALGVDLRSLLPLTPENEPAAAVLLENRPEFQAELESVLGDALIASGMAKPPRDPNRPSYVEKKRRQRVQQAESRKRRAENAGASERDAT